MKVEEVSRTFQIGTTARAQQAVGANFGEAAREYVLKKAREESLHRKCDTARLA